MSEVLGPPIGYGKPRSTSVYWRAKRRLDWRIDTQICAVRLEQCPYYCQNESNPSKDGKYQIQPDFSFVDALCDDTVHSAGPRF